MRQGRPRSSVLVVCLAASLIAGCGSDDPSSSGPSGSHPQATPATSAAVTTGATTEPPTSAPATTARPATSSAPTTVAPTGPGFDPSCTNVDASDAQVGTSVDADLAELGPLGAAPAMIVDLPLGRAAAEDAPQPTAASMVRIPGGILWSIASTSAVQFDGSMLVALDLDGTIRWRRCSEERWSSPLVADVADAPTAALVSTVVDDGTSFRRRWTVISLEDGSSLGDLADLAAADGVPAEVAAGGREVGRSSTRVVLASDDEAEGDVVGASEQLLVVDLATMASTAIPVPPTAVGMARTELSFEETGDGRLLQVAPSGPDVALPLAVGTDGGWSTAPEDLAAAKPMLVGVVSGGDAPGTIGARRADGSDLWIRPDIASHGGEGFTLAVDGDVVLVNGCGAPADATFCEADFALFGLDASTGETIWELPGPHGVGPVADGVAIITETTDDPTTTDWIMIDLATGEPIEGQRWADPYTFGSECCGGEETRRTEHLGGIVVSLVGDRAAVWFPRDLTPAEPVQVSLR